MAADAEQPYYRRPGRLTVWVAHHIAIASDKHSELAGTTYLDQPLRAGVRGAGVLLSGASSRSGRRLSHEVGHVVGMHHVAGPPVGYTYEHPECPSDCRRVEWAMVSRPNCDANIMGSWYDGPYCCPGEGLLQLGFGGRLRTSGDNKCLANSMSSPKSPFCCGDTCKHRCSKDMPTMTFATTEHKDKLAKIFKCWRHLRGSHGPATLLRVTAHKNSSKPAAAVECSDYAVEPGPCTETATAAFVAN
eukprot:gnl/TRDRNA2_/TRDRNA2_35619_c1_seq1.p1 gnl/TRDRNA2_/TRDRNA2_35619_c1~~gnl/TRDRNA2_/TRDRNA2_35619_c1_seq1.p1  ORF type:complete len:265 (-),score=33.70 gnl/TRDRNA2_/TRDRNA2_35619_c1_seq1:104-841(-)